MSRHSDAGDASTAAHPSRDQWQPHLSLDVDAERRTDGVGALAASHDPLPGRPLHTLVPHRELSSKLRAPFAGCIRSGRGVGPARLARCRRQAERSPLHGDGSEYDVQERHQQEDGQPDEFHDGTSVVTAAQRGSSSACPVTCTVGPTGRNHATSGSLTSAVTLTTGIPSRSTCEGAATARAYERPSARVMSALARCAPCDGSATSALAPYRAPSATLAASTVRTW